MPGIHQDVCPFCQCGRLYPRNEPLVVDEADDEDPDSEMGSLES